MVRSWCRKAVAVLALCLAVAAPADAQSGERVLVTTVDGPITPVIDDHLAAALDRAEKGGYQALVVRLDTPGGLDTSMRDIVQRFLAARVPVVVHVAPSGARAASAGALITFAAHVAVMAPGTAIGAATPIDLEGGDLERKVVNDAAAYAASIARVRGRNVDFALDTVRKGRSADAEEAHRLGAVDLLADTTEELLASLYGRQVEIGGTVRTIRAAEGVDTYEMTFLRRVQQRLADPNIAFLLLSLGTLGIVYEFAVPGIGAGGVVGTVMVLLGLFALAVLPVNALGGLFLVLAAGLFLVELFAPGVGIAAAGGVVAMILAAVFLFEDVDGLKLSFAVVLPTVLVVGLAVVLAGKFAVLARREPSIVGPDTLVGRRVEVRRADGETGQAFVEGAWWRIHPAGPDAPLEVGTTVRVVAVDGLTLLVEPAGEAGEEGDA